MLAVIDNYDSFTYNLVHYFEAYMDKVDVFRNDAFQLEELEAYSHIVISPGPGLPSEVPILASILERYSAKKHILGVCLGFQAMVEFYGGKIYNLDAVLHGQKGLCHALNHDGIFEGIDSPFQIGHYHSWAALKDEFPEQVEVLAEDDEGRIMMIRHKEHSSYAVQFHPESVLCPSGKHLIFNWLKETSASTKGILSLDL